MSPDRPSFSRILAYSLLVIAVIIAGMVFWKPKASEESTNQAVAGALPIFAGPYDPREYTIRIETTPCFGTCPAYALDVDGHGDVQLKTHAMVRDTDHPDQVRSIDVIRSSHIDEERHLALVRTLETGGFPTLDPDYSRQVTDNPSVTISVASSRGFWSTHVYAVACVRDARELGSSDGGEFVPDVFCELRDQLHRIACDTYLNSSSGNRDDLPDEFFPPRCDPKL